MQNSTKVAELKTVDHTRVLDSLINFAACMGGGMDKRSQSQFGDFGKMSWVELESLYRSDWIGGKIIEIVPDDMLKNWRTFSDSKLTPEQRTEIANEERRLKLKIRLNRAMRWGRLYGGSVIIINVDDGKDPSEPLDPKGIGKGQLKNLLVFDRRHVNPRQINLTEPFAENFREPETYALAGVRGQIHHTRVVRFEGVALPQALFQRNDYWGDPIFKRIRDALINANVAIDSSAGLLFESNVDIAKVEGLLHQLATEEGTKQLVNRWQTAKLIKANNNMTIIDKEYEELDKQVTYNKHITI